MKKQEIFDTKLEQATEIRTHIQDDLRVAYAELKYIFESFTGQPGKVLKHVTDMYHYKSGGYPNENSAPKHQELIERFAWMVHWFDLIGFSHLYKEELEKYGITLEIEPVECITNEGEEDETSINYPLENPPVVAEALEVLQTDDRIKPHLPKKQGPVKFGQAIRAIVLACDGIQGEICANSNIIKKELAPLVEQNCEIGKGDFSSSVMVNYHKTTGRVTKKKVARLKKNLNSKVETGNYNIENAEGELE